MINIFRTIGIICHSHYSDNVIVISKMLYKWLKKKGYQVIVENKIARKLMIKNTISSSLDDIGKRADLAIIVGGDGNMLGASRILAHYDIKVIGINQGNLGFLTDLDPKSVFTKLTDILAGQYKLEQRFLLEAKIIRNNKHTKSNNAINEIVLNTGKMSRMIEFEVYIDNIFAFSQRSDGIIISTPTGSTAYSLSAGGPILSPLVNAITLTPMLPHNLSSRPLIIDSNSLIKLRFPHLTFDIKISYDSQIVFPVRKNEEIIIKSSNYYLNLLHPYDYNYYNLLSSKLGWLKKLF